MIQKIFFHDNSTYHLHPILQLQLFHVLHTLLTIKIQMRGGMDARVTLIAYHFPIDCYEKNSREKKTLCGMPERLLNFGF